MALTFSFNHRSQPRGARLNSVLVTLDNSYPTGGESVTANDLGLNTISGIVVSGGGQGYICQYKPTNATSGKFIVFSSGTTEVSNATDLSTITLSVLAIGY